MRRCRNTLLFFTILVSVLGCKKDEVDAGISGVYDGVFTVEYSDGRSYSNLVTVVLGRDGSFESSSDPNPGQYYPAGGSGSYIVEDNKILFTEVNGYPADFDWGLILRGEYEYTMSSDELEFSKRGTYRYKLTRR